MKLVNQQLIKNSNLKKIYNYVYQNPGISRARLAKLCALSKTTVSSLTDELIERNFLQDLGINDASSSVGRKPNTLHLLHRQYYVVVISWSLQSVEAKLIDICGQITGEAQASLAAADEYITVSKSLLHRLCSSQFSPHQILGICIIIPGMINAEKQEIFTTMLNISSDFSKNVIAEIRNSFSAYPVAILNDTACAAYAEKIYAQVEQEDFAYINFQHGIGAALFIQSQLLGKATAFYTQFGHYSIAPDGPRCSCGNRGCLELMIGESSIKERLINAGCNSVLCNNDMVTYAELCSAALYGDTAAQTVICDISKDFSIALSNLVCIVHPQLIVIGGKGTELGSLFLNETTKNLKEIGFRYMLDTVQIRYSVLDSAAYFIGGMKYFFDIHYDFTQESANGIYIG